MGHDQTSGAGFQYAGFPTPNGTIVPNDVFDVLMPHLTDAELRVLLYIIRHTRRRDRIRVAISLRQMVEGHRDERDAQIGWGIGLSKQSVLNALYGMKRQGGQRDGGLVAKGVVVVSRRTSPMTGALTNVYALRYRDIRATPSVEDEVDEEYFVCNPDPYRTRLRLAPKDGKVSRERVIHRDGATCYLCGTRLEHDKITLDHVIALLCGGAHSEANLRVACRPCNSRKGAR